MISSNPHDYQSKMYNKLYTLSFVPTEFRIKADYYNKHSLVYSYIIIQLYNYTVH